MAFQAETFWRQTIAGPNLLLNESLGRKLEAMKAELLGLGDSPMEKLLVGRVTACWLQAHYADMLASQAEDAAPSYAVVLQKRQNSAQQRYLSAIKTLATVRKLIRPAPSPLDLAQKPVPETTAHLPARRDRGLKLATGAGVEN